MNDSAKSLFKVERVHHRSKSKEMTTEFKDQSKTAE